MGYRIEQRSFQIFPSLQDLGLLSLLGQVNPFHGQRNLGDKGIKEAAMVRRAVIGYFFQFNTQDAKKMSCCVKW